MSQLDLSGRVALVTGAGQGVGAALAVALAAHGAAVAVNDIDAARAGAVVAGIVQAGGVAMAAVADITSEHDVAAMACDVADELGSIDILVNNAGVPAAGLQPRPFAESTPADWTALVDLNLYGVIRCTRSVIGPMTARGWGRIVSIVSDAGRAGESGFAVYSAAKAGAAGLTRSLAKEVGPNGVTCNCVSLGSLESDAGDPSADRRARHYPMRRLGRPEDVAGALLWLVSEDAGWVTGQTISVNGGYVMT